VLQGCSGFPCHSDRVDGGDGNQSTKGENSDGRTHCTQYSVYTGEYYSVCWYVLNFCF